MVKSDISSDSSGPHQALYENIHLLDNLLFASLKAQLDPNVIEIIALIAKEAQLPYKINSHTNFQPDLEPEDPRLDPHTNDHPHHTHSQITQTMNSLWKILEPLNSETLLALTRAFTQFLNLNNIAEQYHRLRRRRWHQEAGHPPQPGSLEAVLPTLLHAGISKEKLHKTICELNIELVLTAHPTEVTRRTLIHKHNKIAKDLEQLDRENLSIDEKTLIIEHMHEEITALCRTIEVRPQKPSVIEEAKWGFAVISESLWFALPNYMRDLDRKLRHLTGKSLPLDKTPLRFASWMGGDRDGNPNVTAAITRKVIFMSRKMAAELYYHDIAALHESLSIQECSTELRALVGDVMEPYRRLLRGVKEKLQRTQYWAECQMEERELCPSPELIYHKRDEFLEPLLICYRSLQSIKALVLAEGQLLDVIRRVYAFGLTLMPLDIRQNSEKHTALMDALTQSVQLSPYSTWEEKERQDFLLNMLQENVVEETDKNNEQLEALENKGKEQENKAEEQSQKQNQDQKENQNKKTKKDSAKMLSQNILKRKLHLPEELLDYLDIFRVISENAQESFGAYVISMTSKPSDILLVYALQKAVGTKNPIRVVPLFETLEDLNNAENCMKVLFDVPLYKELCKGKQEIMIGYSDSAKDAGYLAASWAQYRAQEALTLLSQNSGIEIIFFHGRGGSVGRGGGPSYLAIRSQPPGSINGALRVTQQGEVIRYRFGLQKIAERTLAIYTTATLEASLKPAKAPKEAWRALMNQLAQISTQSYRALIKDYPDFLNYFAEVTPLSELDKMTIASRPSRRQPSKDIANLRAIPWIFAWVQNRLILPSWYGVGDALKSELENSGLKNIEELRKEWTFFASLLSMLEIVVAKVDPNISKEYEERLAAKSLWPLGAKLRESFEETKSIMQTVLHENKLMSSDPILERSIAVRSPYLLILHLLQITLLEKSRKQKDSVPDEILEQALLVSITGIAAGMLNTG